MAAITTCGDLIAMALKTAGVIGVGQTAQAEDANDCLALLQMMIAQWQYRRWLVPNLIDMAIVSTGAQSYSIGPSPPDRVAAAYCRYLEPGAGQLALDYPLSIIGSHEEYAALGLKTLSTLPAAVFYDSAWPTGALYFWPVPPANLYELHVLFKAALPACAALGDPLNLPPEYLEAALYGLCIRIAINYGLDPRPAHVGAYRAALNTIRTANTQIGTLRMPTALMGRGGIYSAGQFLGGGF